MVMLLADETFTPWMVYELGLAAGLSKKIILFSFDKVDEKKNHLFEQYGPVIYDVDFLIREVKNSFFFAELFEYETRELNKSAFLKSCIENIDLCSISFKIPGIEEIPRHVYKFGYILLAISRYEKLVNEDRRTDICNMTADEIENGVCELDGMPCSLCVKQSFEDPTDVILNKILYNTSVDPVAQSLKIILPFNRQRGMEQISNLGSGSDFNKVLKAICQLDCYNMESWKTGSFQLRILQQNYNVTISDESDTVKRNPLLKQQRYFKVSDEIGSQYCFYHLKLDNIRIHIYPNEFEKVIYVTYVGKHLDLR